MPAVGYHFRHRVEILRPDSTQQVDPDFGEVDGAKVYEPLGVYRCYLRFFNDAERVIHATGERLQGDGKALFRLEDIGGVGLQAGYRFRYDGIEYEALKVTPRAPRLGRRLTIEVPFRRVRG